MFVETPALLSALKSSGCTLTASLTADTPFPVAGEAAMMAYATPGPAEACWTGLLESGPADRPCGGGGGGEASLWPLGWRSGLKVLLAVGRVGPWLLGLTTAVALCRLSGCSSWQGLWGRLSGIWVFGLTCRKTRDRKRPVNATSWTCANKHAAA